MPRPSSIGAPLITDGPKGVKTVVHGAVLVHVDRSTPTVSAHRFLYAPPLVLGSQINEEGGRGFHLFLSIKPGSIPKRGVLSISNCDSCDDIEEVHVFVDAWIPGSRTNCVLVFPF
jgi:hypothetical protein